MHDIPASLAEAISEGRLELVDLIAALARVPAPSHHEEKRCEFCKHYLESFGARDVYVDEAKNVLWPINCEGSDQITLFLAHIDLVFPDTEALPCEIRDGRLYAPGAGDNTANAAGLMYIAKTLYTLGCRPRQGVLIALNSCEEGLGNLKIGRASCRERVFRAV
jgi:acetylornithine deacetylase/succinyl-diaminopimelate desuccinylase-like protein